MRVETRARVLQNIENWLLGRGVSPFTVVDTTDHIQGFLDQNLTHSFIGVTVRKGERGHVTIWLWVSVKEDASSISALFAESVGIPLLPNPAVHLEFFEGTSDGFARTLSTLVEREYLGNFINPG